MPPLTPCCSRLRGSDLNRRPLNYEPFQNDARASTHKESLVNARFSGHRLWGSLALVGSNFLGNSWVRSGCARRAPRLYRPLIIHAQSRTSASAVFSQYVIPISQYIVVAVVRCSCACSRLPVRRSSLPRPRWQRHRDGVVWSGAWRRWNSCRKQCRESGASPFSYG